ncbi:hypothetical protein DDE82_006720 [Stemphylium lycopersici]|uniref:Uncharacterized protein n=1 Tax=Stemphylium lycopersici TaxID=183478 RepID=A0A364MXZ1_STELY|nr:hypothetical protein TW65_08438 [Stemphylium lycopersici]RAR01148.1 hypothetical protein DDE82_006720 [Stemphylium lycopersici]RAR06832.1 hypothetical protein DDE83_006772 [Stemphylium lycopersici]
MSFSAHRLKAFVLTATLLATSTSAQNTTNSTSEPEGCGMSKGYDIPVNASGSTNATDAYVSVTLGDYRDNNRTSSPWLYGYLSVPENSTRQTCMYMYAPIPGTTEGDESNGCSGIISQDCIDYMKRQLQFPIWASGSSLPDNTPCPSLNRNSEEFEDVCGDVGFGSSIVSTNVLNTTNTTCTYSEPPKGVDWNLPDGFKTFLMYGIGVEPYDTGVDNYTDYERAGQTPVPFVISSIGEDGQEGSHEVPESAGARLAWKGKSEMGMLMAFVVATSLMIV